MSLSHHEYLTLVLSLNQHAKYYYADNSPRITDQEYDMKYRQLEAYEAQYPLLKVKDTPTSRIGAQRHARFQSFKHNIKMGSLSNAFSKESLKAFLSRVEKGLGHQKPGLDLAWTIEPKVDGLAVALHYENGALVHAATRGDGNSGEIVTHTVKTIKNLPLKISERISIEVRGEVYMKKSTFDGLKESFANPRNAAAGTLRQLDSKVAQDRGLDIVVYQYIQSPYDSHFEGLQALKKHGFPISEHVYRADTLSKMQAHIDHLLSLREDLDFEIDGAVIKRDSNADQALLGSTHKAPRWAIAYKFPSDTVLATLTSIHIQVGRTGVLTPVATVDPVKVAGVIIKHASLHNMDEINRKDIRIGDTVKLKRAGDVIPKIIESVTHASESVPFKMPAQCPVCDTSIVRIEDEVAYKCINMSCVAQIKGRIKHFASRKAMDIDGLGDSMIDQLVEKEGVTLVSDLYSLSTKRILNLDRMGEKSALNLAEALNKSKKKGMADLLFGLGIPFVGMNSAHLISRDLTCLDDLKGYSLDVLIAIPGIGEKTAQAIFQSFSNPVFLNTLEALKSYGVWPINVTQNQEGSLAGSSFLFTGTLAEMGRAEGEAKVKALGGSISASVNKNLDYLVVGSSAGSKLKKANVLIEKGFAIQILSEAQLLDLLSRS